MKGFVALLGMIFYGAAIHRILTGDMRTGIQFIMVGVLCSIAFKLRKE